MNQFICSGLFRIALPAALLAGVLFRQNLFSLIYLLLLFIGPLLPGPTVVTVSTGHTGRYIRAVLCISLIICLAHIVFHITLLSLGNYGNLFNYCDWKGKIIALVGLHQMDNIRIIDAFRLIGLDFLVMFISAFVHVMCQKMAGSAPANEFTNTNPNEESITSASGGPPQSPDPGAENASPRCKSTTRKRKRKASELLTLVGEFILVVFYAAAGIIQPSLLSSVYFLVFLGVATWLACNRRLGRTYMISRLSLLLYSALHFTAIFLYQTMYAQEFIPTDGLYPRLLGLTALRNATCENARTISFMPLDWTVYVSPLVVLGLYWVLATVSRYRLFNPVVEETHSDASAGTVAVGSTRSSQRSTTSLVRRRKSMKRERAKSECMNFSDEDGCGEKIALLEDDRTGRSYRTLDVPAHHRRSLAADPNGSMTWTSDSEMPEGSVMPDEGTVVSAEPVNKYKNIILSPVVSILRLIAKGSYVATLIIMMTWSITYHSWLTFILLLWSCVLWMTPNSRQACLKSSPFLVAYAEALLLLQFVYGLNLNDDELPRKIDGVNLGQIGLVKYFTLSYQPLAVKILYTIMFWLTLHQYMQERAKSIERDLSHGVLLEPFNISYSTAQPGVPRPADVNRQMSEVSGATVANPFVKKMGAVVTTLLTKYWIWVVACMLMVISLGGDEVVLYRIAYMFLFLFFITMFQFSYSIWRRVMYGFWLTMIVYSMLVLILIYTYQFQNFPNYWRDYLHVSDQIQKDIGLEVYGADPGTLFLKLLTPTFFLIITIIQLHYFHKEFLKISEIDYRPEDPPVSELRSPSTQVTIERESVSTAPGPPSTIVAECSVTPSPAVLDEKDGDEKDKDKYGVQEMKEIIERNWNKVVTIAEQVCEFLWRVMEIHIIKIVLFSVLCLAAYDVCAIHFIFVVFVVLALPVKKLRIFLSHCCSLWVSILLLSKMIYQLNFVDQYGWKVNCTSAIDPNTTDEIDNRIWIGFKKTDNLTSYCRGYIGLIIVLTIQAVVRIRQKFHRHRNNEPIPKPGIVFADITRATADDGLAQCAKFLINHFFYKFGVEFCFVTIVACVGVRLDIFAVFSSIWLCIMFLMKRSTLAKIWPVYVSYQCIVLPIQYLMCVGIPNGLCIEYPWKDFIDPELVEWLYLPDFVKSPNAYKIMVDFFQLVFSCCQLYVFSIETSPVAEMYEGGSNKEIYYNDSQGLTYYAANPVPDFVTYNKSYLDVIKSLCFFGFYWVTLAIMFLAGTSRVSLFAMGYMVGCFIFLWSGNEFYLKPIRVLLKMWNALLAYNVVVILIKSILQVVGCVFLTSLYKNFCWLVQLLGIACLKKLKTGDPDPTQETVGDCDVPLDEAGLLWDGICFAFLLLQKRLFCSYYFQHLVNEIRAQQVLASRGAEMINEIQMREVKAQEVVEKEVMSKIKKKMDKIRAKHQKAPDGVTTHPGTHFKAIRSGDYYMFDDYSDDEIDLDLIAKSSKDLEDEEAAEVKEKGINALLSQAMKGTIKQNIRKGSEDEYDVGESSHLSPIISADRSTEASSVPHPPLSRITSLSLPDTLPPIPSAQPSQSLPPYDSSAPTETEQPGADRRAPGDEKLVDKIKSFCAIAGAFIEGLLISGTAKLNTVSKDYRYVACQLSREKKILKEKFSSGEQCEDLNILDKDIRKATPASAGSIGTKSASAKVAITVQKGSQDLAESVELVDTPDILDQKEQPPVVRFLVAFYYAIVSRSELLCYLMIVVNVMKYASVTSLPLALLAFLWGSLSVPRPSKTFWITIITYTEAIVIIKYLFQFNFFPWNKEPDELKPFWPPRIVGIEKQSHYVVYDLALLLVVFFHRFMLKSLGLWKDSDRSTVAATTPEKTLDEKEDESLIVDLKDEKGGGDKLASMEDDTKLLDQDDEDVEEEESSVCSEPSPLDQFFNKLNQYFDPCRSFFRNLLNPEYRVTVDVYAFMFFCDFINFLILVFGYWAFGTGGGEDGVASYFQENKVPIPFLIMLIVQFALIVMDRALYLRKYIFGKLLFHIFLVFLVHIWMFFVLPFVSEKRFTSNNNLPPKLFYFIKCGYLLLSAYQIRSGYPTRILGNFFCKKFNYVNLFLFKGYLFVPFLYELRCLMDWIWTDTSMNIGNWLKMEDIFSNIFVLKCNRRAEEEYPTPRGSKRTSFVKYGVGGFLLFIVILIIWFPLLLFALGSTVGLPNQPLDFSIVLSIGGYEPIFKMTAQRNNMILGLSSNQYNSLVNSKDISKSAQQFLNNFDGSDITVINLNGNSTAVWAVSPPSQDSLISELRSKSPLNMKMAWSLYRDPNSTGVDKSVGYEKSIDLSEFVKNKLADMLNSSETGEALNVTIPNIFPNYLKASARGAVKFETGMTKKDNALRNLTLSLRHGSFQNSSAIAQWWELKDPMCEGPGSPPYSFLGDKRKCEFLQIMLFSDKVFPSELSIFSGYGIVGLYTTFVLLVSRLIRGFVAGSSFTIMFDDMPYVDRVLQLCLDIYLVRESGEYTLEEDLFAKLIFLYRSPETLIKWTRLPDNARESPS